MKPAAYVAIVVAVVAVVVIGVQWWPPSPDSTPVDEPSEAATDAPPTDPAPPDDAPEPEEAAPDPSDGVDVPDGGTVTLADLGLALVVIDDDTIAFHSPDGTRQTLTGPVDGAGQLRIVVDGHGGVVWQPVDNAADIMRTDTTGDTGVLLSPADGEHLALVGSDHASGGVLVVRTRGTEMSDMTGDLLAVPVDGQQPYVVRADFTGWESGLSFAVHHDDRVFYGLFDAAFEGVFVSPPDGEPTLLLEAGEISGEYVRGVAMVGDGTTGIALIEAAAGFPDLAEVRLLVADLASATVTSEVAVPLDLGADEPWHVVRDVSAHGQLILINRYAQGQWLAPLVHDLASGHWAVLDDVKGRALFVQPER